MTTIGSRILPAPPQLPQTGEQPPRPLFRVLSVAAGGLSAQRVRMEVAAENIANAETTRTAQGGPYRRKTVSLEAIAGSGAEPTANGMNALASTPDDPTAFGATSQALVEQTPSAGERDAGGVRVSAIGEDQTDGPLVYDPGHPDADANGYVRMPNVRVTDELMEMMDARRVYDANATVFQSAKSMLHTALSI